MSVHRKCYGLSCTSDTKNKSWILSKVPLNTFAHFLWEMNYFVHFSLPWNNSAQCCAVDWIWLQYLSISSDDPKGEYTRSLSVILPHRECECRTRSLLLCDMTKDTVISKTRSDDMPIEKKALNRQLHIGLTSNVTSSHNRLLLDTEVLLAFSLIYLYSSQWSILYYIRAMSSPIIPAHSPSGIQSFC